jgi:hypothetical protein
MTGFLTALNNSMPVMDGSLGQSLREWQETHEKFVARLAHLRQQIN